MMRTSLGISMATLALAATPVVAQDSQWQYDLSAYLWFPDTTTRIATPNGPVEGTLSAKDALDALEFGVMARLNARRGLWALTGDLVYFDLEQDVDLPGGGVFSSATASTQITALSGYGFRQMSSGSSGVFELGVGVRAMSTEIDFDFEAGTSPATSRNISDDWADPLLAARYSQQLNDEWDVTIALDYGGFGIGSASEETWQAVASATYAFNEDWGFIAGYRHLHVDRGADNGNYTIKMSGPLLGVNYRF